MDSVGNFGVFVGRVAKAPNFRDGGKQPVCYMTLIRTEYAGRDENEEAKERQVAIEFTAFGKTASNISSHVYVGDQIVVKYALQSNSFEKEGETIYTTSFVISGFEFGAPGKIKREELAQN